MSDELKPEDVKVVSKEEAFWITVKENQEKEIENSRHSITISEHLIELCEKKLQIIKEMEAQSNQTPAYT